MDTLGRNKFRARCRTEDDIALGNRLDILPLHEVGNVLDNEWLCRRLPEIVKKLGVALLSFSRVRFRHDKQGTFARENILCVICSSTSQRSYRRRAVSPMESWRGCELSSLQSSLDSVVAGERKSRLNATISCQCTQKPPIGPVVSCCDGS